MLPNIVQTRLELRQARVQDRIQRFRDLWDSATEWSDPDRAPSDRPPSGQPPSGQPPSGQPPNM
jgi:hypothetical protein